MSIKCSLGVRAKKFKNISKRMIVVPIIATMLSTGLMTHLGKSVAVSEFEQFQVEQLDFEKRQDELQKVLESSKLGSPDYTDALKGLEDVICGRIDLENKKMVKLELEINQLKQQEDQTQDQLNQQVVQVKNEVKTVYLAGGGVAFLDLLLKSDGLQDFISTVDTVGVMNEHYTKVFNALVQKKKELDAQQFDLSQKKEKLEESKAELDNKKAELDKLEQENKAELDRIREEARAANLSMRSSTQSGAQFLSSVPTKKNGRYLWPLPGYNMISSPWGDGRGHLGIDIAGSGVYGAPIIAAADGIVFCAITSGDGGGYGLHVQIDHGEGYSTLYAHMSVVNVSNGQHVKAGQVIGFVGNTGHSFGAHLHFETRFNNRPYDPQIEV